MADRRDIIVVVDDNPVILQAGKNILSGKYDVFTAASADKMFRFLEHNTPALILLDIEMPEIDGYAAIKILKENPETQDIPVVFLTSRTDTANELEGLSLGAVDYITKPILAPLLLKRIEMHVLVEAQKRTLEAQQKELKTVLSLDTEFSRIQDLDILLERILLEARNVAHADAGSIYVREAVEENGQPIEKLFIKYAQNDTTDKDLPTGQKPVYSVFSLPINEKTISGYCASIKKPINVADVYNLPEGVPYSFNTSFDKRSGYKTTSTLAVPLVTAENRLLGVIQVINSKDEAGNTVPFSKDAELLISHFAANAVSVLQQAYITRAMILRTIRMAELRDPKETGTHVNRVAGYALEIYDGWAMRHGVSDTEREKFRDTLKVGAMLHDVGKVAISDVILKKPGRFTPEEYLVMQYHTVYGSSLFHDPLSPLDQISYDIALTHHENWDGTGYPGWVEPVSQKPLKTDEQGKPVGKKGEEIPLAGRIVAVADVYDALCSRRVYKEPWTEEQVLEEIRKLAGTKFDPELVDVFFEVLPNIKQIENLYPEQV
ncbi:MAG: response regulator [Spirochaetales bacterium]|nr:response regulator [Spirochaetales bacterium]